MGEERYKFKWSNMDLTEYVEGRKFAASQLRADAQILCIRAKQIDEEIAALKNALVGADDAE